MVMKINLDHCSYDIVIERGALDKASELLFLDRKALIVTDDGVPSEYSDKIMKSCKDHVMVVLPQGEKSKCMDSYCTLLKAMSESGFTRKDCVVAVGGGVVGDLAGFAAATYMRGIDFYNIPTTLLSQIDSSIGGKTAIDFEGYKNIVGAFYQPAKVLIDPNVLRTLPKRQISNGLAEAIKMAVTSDPELFGFLENTIPSGTDNISDSDIDRIITSSLAIKKSVVEKDEKESGLRRVLNFGHTIGHAIESVCGVAEKADGLYHGECVSIGMLPMCSEKIRSRVAAVLKKADLPCVLPCKPEQLYSALRHDKKAESDTINAVYADDIGSFILRKTSIDGLERLIADFYR